jgi:ribosomal biogenesis protein LAS1
MNMSDLAEDLELPMSVVAIRHEFTHEEIPALSCLRENAKKCLDWLWTWYWAKLDDMVSHVPGDIGRRRDVENAREELVLALNKYVAARIDEVRSKIVQPNERPANVACFHIVRLCKGRIEFLDLLAEALVAPTGRGKGLIPSDKV